MGGTKPLEMSRYALTNKTVSKPIAVTILRYASAEEAKKAFETSGRGRPAAPKDLKVAHWDAAHRWTTDIFLLKGNYAVGVYALPPGFSAEQTDHLLDALAGNIAKAEGGEANGSEASRSQTNSTSSATGSRR